jgi:LysR family transcriptional regulator, benzoate and cis,cis-muconate-responsive activator of ben and cat genes
MAYFNFIMNLPSLSGAERGYGETVRAVRELEKYRDSLLTITIDYACSMELRHLRYFVAVAEEENVSRAALKLHVSQPGVSNQIHDLEDEIGFPLFERTGKSVRLSAAGKIFLIEARDLLQRVADAVEKARAGLASQAEINVGYAPSGTVEILPRALRAFRGSFPGVRVIIHDLSAKEMLPLLLQKKLDIALTLPPRKLPRELDMKELERYDPCVAVGVTHPLAKLKFVSLDQMAHEPVAALTRKDYPDNHKHLKKLFATIGRKPRIGSQHDSGTSLLAAVAAGHEFALVPSSVSGTEGPRVKLLKLRPALPPWSIVVLWRKEAETESVKAFVAAARTKPTKNGRPPAR